MTDLTHGSQGPVKTIPPERYGLSPAEIREWATGELRNKAAQKKPDGDPHTSGDQRPVEEVSQSRDSA